MASARRALMESAALEALDAFFATIVKGGLEGGGCGGGERALEP
eukprot:CAMPEP_0179289768 /NCGR_PEP_ID=MMETSP0797-20121207/41469_1 /TAXON_ID=47934 /ORGANISM="Dinophysis acuminata, Strain DAEP01" /LENGTH=43 /DNA_ID= /DNA_START= /DNA_END= /DNA_ORIENTATION=